ncbi:MAG: hypothetical protein JSW06_05660 [Thermoplasmatales archaeon]|nr:MAG: hypothetical protein JSW06_05660 [Thermoplasmatales archaeon]
MKKQILIIVIMLVLLAVCLCGCTEDKTTTDDESNGGTNGGNGAETSDNSSKFYGIWIEETDMEGTPMTMRHIYSSNGTYTFEILERNHSDTGTWALDDGNLTTSTSHITIYTYLFSDGDTILTLTHVTTEEVSILTKQ